jgi:hypothetical protein
MPCGIVTVNLLSAVLVVAGESCEFLKRDFPWLAPPAKGETVPAVAVCAISVRAVSSAGELVTEAGFAVSSSCADVPTLPSSGVPSEGLATLVLMVIVMTGADFLSSATAGASTATGTSVDEARAGTLAGVGGAIAGAELNHPTGVV